MNPTALGPSDAADTMGTSARLKGLLRTARPRQWVKNVLVFAAPLAAGQLNRPDVAARATLAFALFCLAASAVYFVNDALDVQADRAHPVKRRRPVAAGVVPLSAAYTAGALGAATAVLVSCLAGTGTLTVVLVAYLLVQILYVTRIKHEPLYDLAAIAAGFTLRAIAGGAAAGIDVTPMFLVTAGSGALMMAAGKRYSESVQEGEGRSRTRRSLGSYSASYLRMLWQVACGSVLMAYCLWAFSLDTEGLSAPWPRLSSVPFLLATLAYAMHIDRGDAQAPEDVVLHDRGLLALGGSWLVFFALGTFGV
ncbi:decaprenyl-phosphate phosphoribosyltransferase [Streptoverticillium reticulum]|uniref:decaprenyl-phosphate phosphoribosyltransferase n=1 Tax=Streptoverticillium reticulum TaxID=1433415 RepID=UPI0039BF6637